jgi:hypothetical protein
MLDPPTSSKGPFMKNPLLVNCENCGQEELVDATRPDGTPMLPGEYRASFHDQGQMVVCDRCAAELGYLR